MKWIMIVLLATAIVVGMYGTYKVVELIEVAKCTKPVTEIARADLAKCIDTAAHEQYGCTEENYKNSDTSCLDAGGTPGFPDVGGK